jgi:hypothetical protein
MRHAGDHEEAIEFLELFHPPASWSRCASLDKSAATSW